MNLHSSPDSFHGEATHSAAPLSIFSAFSSEDRASYGHKPFLLKHNLAGHPLFQLDQLERLAREIHNGMRDRPAGDCWVRIWREKAGLSEIDRMASWRAKTEVALGRESFPREISELFDDFRAGRGGASTMLCFANLVNADYRAVLDRETAEIAEIGGVRPSDVTFSGMTVIVSAPDAITPCHNDLEHNMLFQIQGGKDVYLYSQDDPVVLQQDVIENCLAGDGAAARFRPEFSGHETCYRLEPGLAVHHPALAPHWVKNDHNLSISVSMFLHTTATDALAHAHQANWLLRRLGVRPPPPDLSKPADRLKALMLDKISGRRDSHASLFRGITRIKNATKSLQSALHPVRRGAA